MEETFPIYDYHGEGGKLLYQCCIDRAGCHGVRYCSPEPEKIWRLGFRDDADRVLYRLPDLMDPKRRNEIVWIPESEEQCDCLRELGLLTTTNPLGPLAWEWEFGKTLRGRRVAIIPFDDDIGQHRAAMIAGNLAYWNAAKIGIVHLAALSDGGNVKDWLADFDGKEAKVSALMGQLKTATRWERVK